MLKVISITVKMLPCDPLLHQIATLHVQEEGPVLSLNLARRNDLKRIRLCKCYTFKLD